MEETHSEPQLQELQSHVERILQLMGEDATREGLVRTPLRVARAMQDLTRGYGQRSWKGGTVLWMRGSPPEG